VRPAEPGDEARIREVDERAFRQSAEAGMADEL
jgi:predicted N-acetyltransferase YhbS